MTEKIIKNYYNILDKLEIKLNITENTYNLNLENLFSVGARINPKRSFLFISKLIGKHLAINPDSMIISGKLLGLLYFKKTYKNNDFDSLLSEYISFINNGSLYNKTGSINLEKKTLFIGFAETATGLASSVFSLFGKNAFFICTTREYLPGSHEKITFLEEHSHATNQICYLSKEQLEIFENIILIDDELTTGNTNLNIISRLNEISPGKKYTLISILDWRNKKNLEKYSFFSKNNSIEINSISLIKGEIKVNKNFSFSEDEILKHNEVLSNECFTINTKIIEFNINNKNLDSKKIVNKNYISDINKKALDVAEFLSDKILSENTLIIGSGEFIYFPALICKHFSEINNAEIKFQSFSRSPVLRSFKDSYPINFKISFSIDSINYFLYNIDDSVDNALIIFDKRISNNDIENIKKAFSKTKVSNLTFLFMIF